MDIIQFNKKPKELPLKVLFSAQKMVENFEIYSQKEGHPFQKSSLEILEAVRQFPVLTEGTANLEDLEEAKEVLDVLMKPLFADPLQENEIKALALPFTFSGFHPTERFKSILKNAGNQFKMTLEDFDDDILYMYACSFILGHHYGYNIDFTRPIYLDIPDKTTGHLRHYRILINADFTEVFKTADAPDITKADVDELLLNADDIEVWKKKFPPGSYLFKGFSVINLYDATLDVTISRIRSLFLRNDEQVFSDFERELGKLFGVKDLMVGYSVYDLQKQQSLGSFFNKGSRSLFLEENERVAYQEMFCQGILKCAIQDENLLALPDVEQYGTQTDGNDFYQRLQRKNIKSIILIPLKIGDKYLQLIELATTNRNELNALNAKKLEDIIPFIEIASKRYIEESINALESTIQENYTTIHPAVKWRFSDAATAFNRAKLSGKQNPTLEEISFDNIYPLYGQADIKGSSVARNEAIQSDLEWQLALVIETFEKILEQQPFPIYKKLIYRVETYLNSVKKGLDAGDEISILEFLKKEIYPVFNHLKTINTAFEEAIANYMANIDPNLHVVYRVRKSYDESVTLLNDRMAAYLDMRQEQAQEMFPHYFQKYKTDGVEYNIYIGQSLVCDRDFNEVYLQNLRLWQLETMWGLEQVAHNLLKEMSHPLRVASLILIHSHPLSIKFHMDQKAFDVDGAYNARYEIVKKRIDKSHIKGTAERLTQPGKIAIVYSQDEDAEEYLEYLKYWQSEGLFGKIENLELEDLQGISGLRALRVEVIYKNTQQQEEVVKVLEEVEQV